MRLLDYNYWLYTEPFFLSIIHARPPEFYFYFLVTQFTKRMYLFIVGFPDMMSTAQVLLNINICSFMAYRWLISVLHVKYIHLEYAANIYIY